MIFTYLGLLTAAGSALAVTPQGFSPGVQAPLYVVYSDSVAALNGATMSKITTAKEPFVGTEKKLTGKSYAIVMVDMDVPTSEAPKTKSLLHWMQTDLVPVNKQVTINTTVGTKTVFPIQNLRRVIAAAPYIGPDPPAQVPLNHRYAQVLIDTSQVGQDQMRILSKAATKRDDFNVAEALSAANIPLDKVVAGNFFQVTNPGPVQIGSNSSPSSNPSPTNGTKPVPQPVPGVMPGGMKSNGTATNFTMPAPKPIPRNGTSPAIPKSPATNTTGPAIPKSPATNSTNPAMPKYPATNGTSPAMPKSPITNGTSPATPKQPGINGTSPAIPKPLPGNGSSSLIPKPANGTRPPIPGLGSNGTMPKPGMLPPPAFPSVNSKANILNAAASLLVGSLAFCLLL